MPKNALPVSQYFIFGTETDLTETDGASPTYTLSVPVLSYKVLFRIFQAEFSEPLLQLMVRRTLGPSEARALQVRTAAAVSFARECSALDLLRATPELLTSGLPSLDAQFGGGLQSGCLTELCGAAGTGKSQLCTQLAARASAILHWPVLVIDSELRFSAERFAAMAAAVSPDSRAAAERCFVYTAADDASFRRVMSPAVLEPLLDHFRARLLVVDSIAAPLRLESDLVQRSQVIHN